MKVLRNVPVEDIVSWKDGFFYFRRASLKEVMQQLARWYDVEVEYAGAVPNVEFGGKIDRNLPLKDLLQFLDKNQVHFRLEGRKITIPLLIYPGKPAIRLGADPLQRKTRNVSASRQLYPAAAV